ncbi:MAG: aminodeoxychorismate/anthranilate synthase component II [Synergistetes bacterium]|nr:aminodeoxychorismate/anthranilate synthase component II [Synergistota bacterium]MCX8128005.1 aminodeoxychorismate/anthranilate synthase component II [Synergistota bacterium]MDW8192800.1 aminodeoxychorismate/anthranilate synthase component II [Synergistota bacterium]
MILVIDNYDSFTYNLVQYLLEFDDVIVFRNDKVSLREINEIKPSHIVISPGPGNPNDAGISNEVIKSFYRYIPILGICLGHQCIGYVFGGIIGRAKIPMHGKTSFIYHSNKGILHNIPSPFLATRYHSLVVKQDHLPKILEIIAETEDGEIMGIMHKDFPTFGLQFHPESVLTSEGKKILENFLKLNPIKRGELNNVR